MREHSPYLHSFFAHAYRVKDLILQLIKQEVRGRYKGSLFGLLWALFLPILMLAVYTFVFSVVFQAKWGGDLEGGKAGFALFLFSGLIPYMLFAECVNRSSNLMIENPSYVKKILFPLDILPLVMTGGSLFHLLVNVFVLLLFSLITGFGMHFTVLLLPFILLPLLLFTLGLCWFLASLGVYLRDTGHLVGVCVSALLFLSPIFYPLSALPLSFQSVVMLSPLTGIIEMMRSVLLLGHLPSLFMYAISLTESLIIAFLGYAWFQRTRSGFADVL